MKTKLWKPVVAAGLMALLLTMQIRSNMATSEVPASPHQRPPIYFVDVTTKSNARSSAQRTWGASWIDSDADGDADLTVGRHWFKPMLLINRGGSYVRRSSPALQAQGVDRHACVWGEANGDGRPDLYCVQGADKGTGSGPNQLLLQAKRGFIERAMSYGVADPFGRGRTANWIDHDSDGDLDLFVGNHARSGTTNHLYENRDERFVEIDAGVTEALGTVSSSWADWDNDRDPDLLVMQHAPGRAVAYRNDDGVFRRTELRGITDRHWQAAAFGDYDGDGWIDVHLVSVARSVIMRNRRGTFRRAHFMSLREGRMSAWFDVDNDSDLDAFVVQGAAGEDYRPTPSSVNHPDVLLVNRGGRFERLARSSFRGPKRGNGDAVVVADHDRDGDVDVLTTNGYFHWAGTTALLDNRSRTGNWAGLDLYGGRHNPLAVGAVVTVRAGVGLRYRRAYTDGFNFRSQSEVGYVHLGLGDARRARVRVGWLGGGADCTVVASGQIVALSKGASPC